MSSRGSSPAARASASWVGGRSAGKSPLVGAPAGALAAACQSLPPAAAGRAGRSARSTRTRAASRVRLEQRGQQDSPSVGRELVDRSRRQGCRCRAGPALRAASVAGCGRRNVRVHRAARAAGTDDTSSSPRQSPTGGDRSRGSTALPPPAPTPTPAAPVPQPRSTISVMPFGRRTAAPSRISA